MALALSLVGQPVQPYLTTGATDFVNSVQKGKEDAIKLKQADIVNQKSALDLLTAQKKVNESSWATTNATDLKAKADKGQLDAESMARMQEANPEFAKLLGTAQADAVKNFYASNLIGLNSATDQTGFLNGLVQAHDAHNAPLPESVRKDPKLAIQYYKMLLNGAKAFDDKTASMDESGNVITKDALGNTTAINRAAVKAAKATPVVVNGKEVIRPLDLGNGKTRTERKLSDGTWENLGESSQKDVKPDPVDDPVDKALAIIEGKEKIKAKHEQIKAYREKYANASDAIPLLDAYIAAAKQAPDTGFDSWVQTKLGYYGLGDKKQQDGMAMEKQAAESLLTFAVKQPGPSTDRDVESYRTQMGVIADPNASTSQKVAAAEQAKKHVLAIQKKYGAYLGDILSGKINPEDIAAKEVSNDPYAITKDTDPRRAKYLLNHKALVDAKDYEGAKLLTELYKKGAK